MADLSAAASAAKSRAGLGLLLLVVCTGLLLRALDRDLNHDEHQFLAPAALLSRDGLLPYRDYPLFHLPNLVFAYAALDRLTGELLLSAKLLSVASTCGVVLLVALVMWRGAGEGSGRSRWLLTGSVLALFVFTSLTVESTGKTWNHELPSFLTVAALLLHAHALRRDALLFTALSGGLLGLAIGTRLTFAPLGLAFALFPLLLPLAWTRRLAHVAVFGAAGVIACAPSLYFLAVDREAFLFGNFEFPRLRLLDPDNTRIRKTMSWWRKLRYFAKEIVVPNWPLFLAYAAVGVRPAWAWFRSRGPATLPCALLLCTLPMALLGCFAPSRYQYQHYYLFAPLLVLGVALGAAAKPPGDAPAPRVAWVPLTALAALLTLIVQSAREGGAGAVGWLQRVGRPAETFPARMKQFGRDIRQHVPEGKVLTLAPTEVLEGGLRIYPEFATGPFAWRSAGFAPAERRRELDLVAPADLEEFLRQHPPAAILTGVEEKDLEAPLVAYAEGHGFRARNLAKRRVLWLPPAP